VPGAKEYAHAPGAAHPGEARQRRPLRAGFYLERPLHAVVTDPPFFDVTKNITEISTQVNILDETMFFSTRRRSR
jgi:hypothetical protein